MRQVVANSRSWLAQAGCDKGVTENKLGQIFYDSKKFLLENNSQLIDNIDVYSNKIATNANDNGGNEENLLEKNEFEEMKDYTSKKYNTLHNNRKLLASLGGFFSGIVLIISCFMGYKYMTSGGKF